MTLTNVRLPLFAPDWLVDGEYHDEWLGILKTGKESEVSLVARVGADGRTSYLAEKRFKSRMFRGFQDDAGYREDWFRGGGGARALRGVKRGREAGHRLLAWRPLRLQHPVLEGAVGHHRFLADRGPCDARGRTGTAAT